MVYKTIDYLLDSHQGFWEFYKTIVSLKRNLLKFFDHVIQIDYDVYVFRFFDNLLYGILIVYLGLVGTFTLAKYWESGSGVRISAVTTSSMSPAITPGSLIISSVQEKYSKGDIISFTEVNPKSNEITGRNVTHRIVKERQVKKNTYFVTKGDSNEQPDPGLVSKQKILGKVILIFPFLGYFYVLLKTFPGFLVLVGIPAFILIYNEVKFIKEETVSLKKVDFQSG